MALKSLICPQCGAQIELDDSDKDYGFCTFCGAKIQLNEIISVKHSGTVTLDNTSQAMNRLSIAAKAFESRNFGEAYEYYTKALEDIPDDYKALYRKGICAIYLSSMDNLRSDEFVTLINSAKLPDDSTTGGAMKGDLILAKDQDIAMMLKSLLGYINSNSSTMSCTDSCVSEFRKLMTIAAFAKIAISYLDTESVKEDALSAAIDFCDKVSSKKLNYVSGTKTDKNGKTSEVISVYNLDADSKKRIEGLRAELADQYNNLPSRVAKNASINSSIAGLESDIKGAKASVKVKADDVKAAKKTFMDSSEGLKKARKKALLPALIAFGVFAIAAVIFFICKNNTVGWILVVAAIIIPILLAKLGIARFYQTHLPANIKEKINDLKKAKKHLAEKEKSLRTEQKNLKSFNKTKK